MPYVLPSSTTSQPRIAPLPVTNPTSPPAAATNLPVVASPSSSSTDSELENTTTAVPATSDPIASTSTSKPTMAPATLSDSAVDIQSPSPPTPISDLIHNFAGAGLSDGHVPTLQNRHEADPIVISAPASASAGKDDMPRLPSAKMHGEPEWESQSNVSSRRPSEPASLPDLADGETSSSSTSIDTLADSPIDGGDLHGHSAAGRAAQVILADANEEDPKMVALMRYKEGLYTYTRGLYLEAKSSTTRNEKRRASTSSGSASTFGAKQSGMERLAAKKALARRLNG